MCFQMMGNVHFLDTNIDDAPRAVIYTDGEDIATAYLVADAEIKIEIPKATIEKVIAGLFASYYVWNRNFPKVYANILTYMSNEILKSPISNVTTLRKFIRSLHSFSSDTILQD